jgi:threonine dehydrogenase-like Zn-dependent dehydrogenase
VPTDNRTALAFWIAAPGRGEIRREMLPEAVEGEVLVRTLFTGISRGTESLIFRGEVPESEHERMRCPFQAGDFPGPVKYGYINVGMVEDGPPHLAGHRVFCLYPHQTRYVVPESAVHPLPADVPAARAVLAANLETALNGLWDAGPRLGERISVVGGGTLGCLAAWLAGRIPGCRVELIDPAPAREATAQSLGVRYRSPEAATPDADLVIHASGSPGGLAAALRLAAFEGRVVEMSWFGSTPVPLPLGEGFHQRRLTLISSQVGTVSASMRPRWDHRRRMELVLSLLAEPALDVLVTGEDRFEDLPAVLVRLAAGPGATLCHRIRYS